MSDSDGTGVSMMAGVCIGVVRGIAEAAMTTDALGVCLNPRASLNQLIAVVVRYFDEHPDELEERGSLLVLRAFQDAYPCQETAAGSPSRAPESRQNPTLRRDIEALRSAAEQGDAEAQRDLGFRYEIGCADSPPPSVIKPCLEPIAQDYEEAERWYRLAAEQGDVDAQILLAVLYDSGPLRGDTEAARWYRRAAEQGEPFAQSNLWA